MEDKTKLTYEEYMKAVMAGAITGSACGCVGPQDQDEFCPCEMHIFECLDEQGVEKMKNRFRKQHGR